MKDKDGGVFIYLRREQVHLITEALELTSHELHDRWDTAEGFKKLNEINIMVDILKEFLNPKVDS